MKTPQTAVDGAGSAPVASVSKTWHSVVWTTVGVLVVLGWMALVALSWMQEAKASDDPEYDFSWLDPDKKVQVLQNRRYRKALHPMISVLGGAAANTPYRNSYIVEPRVAFSLSESFTFEGFYGFHLNSENSFYESLVNAGSNALPTIRESNSRYGGLLQWSPWYAKINVFNAILYFDWYFSIGAGVYNTTLDLRDSNASAAIGDEESNFAIYAATGHQYHINEWLKVRLDITSVTFNAPVSRTGDEKDWFTDATFTLGLGVQL